MAAMGAILIAFMVTAAAAPAAYAVQHTVGGDSQWGQGVDYDQWAQGETFVVGDTLLFKYTGLHSVYQVKEGDYNGCNSGKPIKRYSGGSTTVTLSGPGTYYFICPTGGHCDGGMKVVVTVTGAGSSDSDAPPSSSTTATQPPKSTKPSLTGSTGNFREVNFWLAGFFMTSAAAVLWF